MTDIGMHGNRPKNGLDYHVAMELAEKYSTEYIEVNATASDLSAVGFSIIVDEPGTGLSYHIAYDESVHMWRLLDANGAYLAIRGYFASAENAIKYTINGGEDDNATG